MRNQRILVVEDHEAMRIAIQNILEDEGYTVLSAVDGVEALKAMKETSLDLILADIMMPRMDGYTLYEKIRARPEWVPIPFIFLTAKSEHRDMLKGKELGVEDYITKPFDAEELVVTVRSRLRRAQAIQEVAEAEFEELKQQIATVLGHELRTPLTYVSGYTELALEEVASLSRDELEEFLNAIKRGSDRLADLVEDLLLLVRLDTGQAAEEFHELAAMRQDIGEIVKRAVRRQEEQAAKCGVTLRRDIGSDLPPARLCEPFFIDALSRVIENGIKFSRDKGGQVAVSVRAEKEWIEVAVSDEGIGIPPDRVDSLFERFQQIDRDRLEQQGVGLGLFIARELMLLHDGDVVVESTPEQGSTFTILLPRVDDER